MSCRLVDFPVKRSGRSFPLTILKFFLRFIRHFESSALDDIARDGGCCIKKDIPTPKRRDVGNAIA